MLAWDDTSIPHRILLVVTFATFGFVLFVAPEDFAYSWVVLPLFLATFIYHFVDFSRARRRIEQQRQSSRTKDSRLEGKALKAPSSALPVGGGFALIDIETGEDLGTIEREHLRELIKNHEEWGLEENDFFIMEETIQVLKANGASNELIELLKEALKGRSSMEIRWPQDSAT